jgi:hypothetical protein
MMAAVSEAPRVKTEFKTRVIFVQISVAADPTSNAMVLYALSTKGEVWFLDNGHWIRVENPSDAGAQK